jgi:hypothetical protein
MRMDKNNIPNIIEINLFPEFFPTLATTPVFQKLLEPQDWILTL